MRHWRKKRVSFLIIVVDIATSRKKQQLDSLKKLVILEYFVNCSSSLNYKNTGIISLRLILHTWTCFTANIYLFKAKSRNTRKSCEICSKLKIKTPERRQ